jgi:hypothetical protein
MKLTDLPEHVDNFRRRVMADALQEATAAYWRRRAQTFATALPREGDFTGRATPDEIEARRQRVAAVVLACSERAAFSLGGEVA